MFNHLAHLEDMQPDNGYDENGKKINDVGGDKTDYILRKTQFGGEDVYVILESTEVKHTYSPYGNHEGYGYRMHNQLQSPALYDPSFDVAITQIGGGLALKGIGLGGKYLISNFNRATGGLKQWIRTGSSYSIEGGFKTYSTRWGAGGKHWKKIGNTTLQNWNKTFRQTKLPGNNWRVKDPGHFHWWKK
ncbi:hypothetical protein [Chryseobacterium gallinarum]|nr:hypothetical protein [Chryseobacterium gallinarum]